MSQTDARARRHARQGMKVHESIDIAARREQVWPLLADPQRMADWHAKLDSVRRNSTGPVYVGERFGTSYLMSRKKQSRGECETEVLRCEPWTTIVLRHRAAEMGPQQHVDETFELSPRADGAATHVEHTVDFSRAGMPAWARALMWCITRFGESRGEGILQPLRRACEVGRMHEGA
jgi:uncharacterized protein YndB with AHSA1/START domain